MIALFAISYILLFLIGIIVGISTFKFFLNKQNLSLFIAFLPYLILIFPGLQIKDEIRISYFWFMIGVFLCWSVKEYTYKKANLDK
jgi:hypothetical protein